MSLNCKPLNTGDQYWTELLIRREKAVLLAVASVTHTELGVVAAIEPEPLLTMFAHCALFRAPVASPLPMMIPEDANPPELSRSEEHTSELQSPCNLVCRLLLEKN